MDAEERNDFINRIEELEDENKELKTQVKTLEEKVKEMLGDIYQLDVQFK